MLDDLLRGHDGVITLAQARAFGVSEDAVRRRARSGRWRRCGPGVYFANDRPFTAEARIRAAVWSYGIHATASGLSAAYWHGVSRYAPQSVDVTVPLASNGRRRSGTRLRRRDLSPTDIVERNGLRVTALPLTVIEAAVRQRAGAKLLDSALQGRVELHQLWHAQLRNKGRHGSPAARRLLDAAADGARSEAERLLIQLLRAAKLDGWKANHPVCGYVVDVAFPQCKVAIEVDGWAFHSDQATFQRDRQRQNRIALHGWTVLRFTWLDLTEYPQRVLAEIRSALSAS